MNTLLVPAKVEEMDRVIDFISARLEEREWPMKQITRLSIAAEEIFVNIAHYAYAPDEGDAEISVWFEDDAVLVSFADSGMPYNPLERQDPDTTLSAEDRDIGGLGIFMVKKSMDDVTYEHRDGKNVLTLKKSRA